MTNKKAAKKSQFDDVVDMAMTNGQDDQNPVASHADLSSPNKEDLVSVDAPSVTEGGAALSSVDKQHYHGHKTGPVLRAAREKLGMSIEDVAAQLKIRSVYLHAIEDQDYDNLPEEAFTLGFVRSCAKLYGLSGDDVVAAYRESMIQDAFNDETPYRKVIERKAESYKNTGSKLWVWGLLLLLTLAVIAGSIYLQTGTWPFISSS